MTASSRSGRFTGQTLTIVFLFTGLGFAVLCVVPWAHEKGVWESNVTMFFAPSTLRSWISSCTKTDSKLKLGSLSPYEEGLGIPNRWHKETRPSQATGSQSMSSGMRPDELDGTRPIQAPPCNTQFMRYFTKIELVKRLGVFCWNPNGLRQKRMKDVNVDDILQGLLERDTPPPRLVPLGEIDLPLTFPQLSPQIVPFGVFPYSPSRYVPLFVAKEKGVDLQDVDFYFYSGLGSLAAGEIRRSGNLNHNRMLVQKCPVTGIIVLSIRNINMCSNKADIGHLFERLLTAGGLYDMHDLRIFRNLQLVKIAGYTVLLAGEIDAVDEFDMPVELKTGNPKYFTMERMIFGMIADGSRTLITCDRRGPHMERILQKSFDDVVREYSTLELRNAEGRLAHTLHNLRQSSEITAGAPMELDFDQGRMVLKPFDNDDDLSWAVVEELFTDH